MKLISRSRVRRRAANAPLRSFGGPQMPSPVRRIAPKPRRCTESLPPSKTSPAALAERFFLLTIHLQTPSVIPRSCARVQQSHVPLKGLHGTQRSKSELLFLARRANVPHQGVNLCLAQPNS